jgi:hypothetical protein
VDIPDIVVLEREPIEEATLRTLVERFFGDMVKFVVDIERGVAAVGGHLHSDAVALLLERGSRQADLWGGNYFPGLGPGACLEYTSLINIRPAQGNHGMQIQDEAVKLRVREIALRLIGEGDALE